MKGNVIRLNIMHLNSVHLNSIGEVQSVSLKAGESTEDPVYPPTTYTLAANVSNGKVTATKNGTAISLPYVATEGDVIVLSVTPDEGYEFNGWLDGNKSNPRTVTMTGNVVLSASCVEIAKPTYTLSASVTNGKVSAKRNGSAVNLPFTANEGDVIVLEVTPNDGYTFEGWNDGNTDNPRSITMTADVALSAQCVEVVQPPVGKYIQFEDKAVEAICVANWSSDGIGLTEEDAAKVTTIGTTFKGNTAIQSFDELEKFTNVKWLLAEAFSGCTSLQSISLKNIESTGIDAFKQTALRNVDAPLLGFVNYYAFTEISSDFSINLPLCTTIYKNGFYKSGIQKISCTNLLEIQDNGLKDTRLKEIFLPNVKTIGIDSLNLCPYLTKVDIGDNVTSIGNFAFGNSTSLETLIVRATTPPSAGKLILENTAIDSANGFIYVPDASLEAYKTATNWNQYSARIKPLSEYVKE